MKGKPKELKEAPIDTGDGICFNCGGKFINYKRLDGKPCEDCGNKDAMASSIYCRTCELQKLYPCNTKH